MTCSKSMALLSETTAEQVKMGKTPERMFDSPNVPVVPKGNNMQIFRNSMAFEKNLWHVNHSQWRPILGWIFIQGASQCAPLPALF